MYCNIVSNYFDINTTFVECWSTCSPQWGKGRNRSANF